VVAHLGMSLIFHGAGEWNLNEQEQFLDERQRVLVVENSVAKLYLWLILRFNHHGKDKLVCKLEENSLWFFWPL
jgi:hypothetical protein